ncbi:uncharacterized protein EI90DRAFT_2286422 [Cantharellus anzutake]|uniref:uncharacterized protein n=1 Tax=Cantharellus anzutake TaxID=1750568 RepID=UPI001906965D|nr:uncharacterized protein EI90DRAFT_2286422 [Cantharellus anzutake]KAF8339804.1 hypothetical protein EI90DRAFT_2286422 [Cantharellus anzutake]
MARTFQTRARRERAKLLAIQQKQQIEGHLNDRENVVKDEDIDDTGPGSAPTATAFTQQNVGKTLFPSPPPREITASPLSLASPRPGRVNLPLISRQSTTSSNASTMIGPSTSSRRMSLQSILHPSNEDPMSKLHHATPPPTLPGVGAGLTSPSNVVLPPLVRSPYSSSPEIPRYPSAGATSPHSSFGNPPSAMNGPSPNLRLAAAGYPLTSPFLTHFNATTASPSRAITSLDEALAEVGRLRDMYKASFEYIEVLERANEELRRLGSLSPTISTTSAGTSLSSRTTTTNPSMSPISPKSSIRGYCR